MAERETPGQRIRNLREAAFITQKDFAERIGVAPSQLSRIESGETKTISSDILIAIATEFDVSTDYLLGLSTFQKPRNVDVTMTGLFRSCVQSDGERRNGYGRFEPID